MQCVLGFILMYIAVAHSWDVAVTHGHVLEFYANETITDSIRFDSHNLAALVYDEVHNMLLYVDKQSGNDAICGYDISSKENKCFIERNGRNIHGLSFDSATELLFFTDTNERSINWISLKAGSNNNIYGNLLIKMDDRIPTDIAVDSCKGYVYWINTNLAIPTIERARFNGSDREVIIGLNSLHIKPNFLKLEPHSLAIDQETQKIYWIEPETRSFYRIYYADLKGKNKTAIMFLNFTTAKCTNPSANTLTVSKTSLFWVDWCSDREIKIWKVGKIKWTGNSKPVELHSRNVTVGVTAKYEVKGQDINDCEALSGEENKSNSDIPFCVNGVKAVGQSLCICSLEYIGEQCDVSVCDNFCFQGNCSVNDEGFPKCSCNPGHTGKRCEVNECRGHCLNNGNCSFNENSGPVCQCKGYYTGDRCEVSNCINYCLHGKCSFNDKGKPKCRCNPGYFGKRCEVDVCHGYCLNNGVCAISDEDGPTCECVGRYRGLRCEVFKADTSTGVPKVSAGTKQTLADLLANWQKPSAKVLIIVDDA